MRLYATITTVEDIINDNAPSLLKMKRLVGTEYIEAYVMAWLVDLNNSVNTKRGLKESQIREIAFKIVSKYGNLTIPDLNIIFGRAKEGGYGKLYESLSMDKILPWFEEYFDIRCEVAATIAARHHDQLKYQEAKIEKIAKSTFGELRKALKK